MRHSKSCSNHLRQGAENISSQIRDPGLTVLGRQKAIAYGPILRTNLANNGFNVDSAIVCASTLKRAQDTARLVFDKEPRILQGFSENGVVPENTPASGSYEKPDWKMFLKQLQLIAKDGDSLSVVGHGSYLRSLWPLLTGAERKERLNNMDGLLCEADLTENGLHVTSYKEIPCSDLVAHGSDTCSLGDTEKIKRLSSMKGGANMPLAFFKDGAQMQGTYGEATGASWFRPTLYQTGGKKQRGGFSPSVMGSFATNGLRLMPVAAYMGYKMFTRKKAKKAKKAKKTRRTRKH